MLCKDKTTFATFFLNKIKVSVIFCVVTLLQPKYLHRRNLQALPTGNCGGNMGIQVPPPHYGDFPPGAECETAQEHKRCLSTWHKVIGTS